MLPAFTTGKENIRISTRRPAESKEISNQLASSVHTVNAHRQRILEKLNVDNSIETIRYVSHLGWLD